MARHARAVETTDVDSAGARVGTSRISSKAVRSGDVATASSQQQATLRAVQRDDGGPKNPEKPEILVDAFLGEWLNPQYFEDITPPPPSTMMVASAKGELLQSEPIDAYVPSNTSRPSTGKLWGGGRSGRANALDDPAHAREQLPVRTRDRASSQSSIGSIGRPSSRKSPFRPGGILQPLTSSLPNSRPTVYSPPIPHYAISPSDHIPKGYVAHARDSCTNVNYDWDSSRSSLDWGNGGTLGESWSEMHKRLRRGISGLVEHHGQQYSRYNEKKGTNADQPQRTDDDEPEDLVVILVTHNATGNALIGALTGQPALVDLGVASLTWADRRETPDLSVREQMQAARGEDVSRKSSYSEPTTHSYSRRGSLDRGLSAVYKLRLIASTDHLRPQLNTLRTTEYGTRADAQAVRDSLFKQRQHSDSSGPSSPVRHGTTRRPSAPGSTALSGTDSATAEATEPAAAIHTGLWQPPTARKVSAQNKQLISNGNQTASWLSSTSEPSQDQMDGIDGRNPSADSLSAVAEKVKSTSVSAASDHGLTSSNTKKKLLPPVELDGARDECGADSEDDFVAELPKSSNAFAVSPNRHHEGNKHEGLQSSPTAGLRTRDSPKRRWTITHND